MLGFNIFKGLDGLSYMASDHPVSVDKSRSCEDDILDLIYSVDPITNLPSGSIEQYLSDKTNNQVRDFIEKVIFKEIPRDEYPDGLREEILKLDSDFIAKTSRNRFEPLDEYEKRVESYFNEIENSKEFEKKVAKLRETLTGKKDVS